VSENGSAFEFPCDIPVKVFGRNDDTFRDAVFSIVQTYFPDFQKEHLVERLSRQDRYLSLTVTVWVESRASIDALYTELSGNEVVLMVL
jgi:putative lipoic acid-binding regulatory protein